MNKKQAQIARNELNLVIATRNLYRNGRRYINAQVVGTVLVVVDLYSNDIVEFKNDGSFTDGNVRPVKLDLPAPVEKPTPLWVWEWEGGGYNQAVVNTKREARAAAEKIWPGRKPVNMKALRSRRAQKLFWKNYPLFD